jgi:ATP-dependent DNA ligase
MSETERHGGEATEVSSWETKVKTRTERIARTCFHQTNWILARSAENQFGSPLVLSHVHWDRPQLVAEITYLTWTGDRLLRQTVYVGLRADKPGKFIG